MYQILILFGRVGRLAFTKLLRFRASILPFAVYRSEVGLLRCARNDATELAFPFPVYRLQFTAYRLLFTVCRSEVGLLRGARNDATELAFPFPVYRLPFTVYRLPFTVYRLLFTIYFVILYLSSRICLIKAPRS